MGIISRYRLGAMMEKQMNMQVRRQVYLNHRAHAQPETIGKQKGLVKKTFAKEAKYAGKQQLMEHMYKARRTEKELKKASRKMSKREAARVAAMARWGVR